MKIQVDALLAGLTMLFDDAKMSDEPMDSTEYAQRAVDLMQSNIAASRQIAEEQNA